MVRIGDEYIGCACRVQQENPKRQKSAERYEKYKHGRTLREVLDLGASRADIAHDMVRGYIVVEDREVQKAILSTANESERRHLPAHLQGALPPSSGDPRGPPARPAPRPKYAPAPARAPPPKAPPRKLAPNPYARRPDDDDDRKRRRDADLGNLATDKNVLRNRAVACNKKRAKIFGRTVGKGRLLPVYNDDV
jgi:hypothetical protein